MSDSSSNENIDLTPAEIVDMVTNAEMNFIPEKSRDKYLKAYNLFNTWRSSKGANTFSESVILAYFIELSKTKKSSTLWSTYSMLKATLKMKKDVQIEKYPKLLAFLKTASRGYKPKKSKVFTSFIIEKFLNEAPDFEFLATKVVLIIGISGACRTNEITFLTTNNIKKHSDNLILVTIPDTKTQVVRNFVIRDEYVNILEKYKALRPPNTATERFFLQYRSGKCVRQPMGHCTIGGMPRKIATFLNLAEPEQYTGHCFRRTSATLLADSGADLSTLKRHGGWKSNTVAEGYIEDSLENKSKICKGIVGGITLKSYLPEQESRPSTSKHNETESTFNTKSSENPPLSPTFTPIESMKIKEYCSQPKNSTQITSTNITVPNKNITLQLTNCNNCTFNF